ncbi:universal stress protein [Sinomonas sp. P47F7]|uniref:universal stress protein n=1 Tax=Sinomonas sp. P47F7 TaxID=3410987 RepID=UPI003BF5EA24
MEGPKGFVVVAGVDGSPESYEALAWAVDEARLRGGEVLAVTGWEYRVVTVGMEAASLDKPAFAESAARILTEAVKAVHARDVQIRKLAAHGSPAKVIIDAAKDADLVVVGSRGHGGFAGLLLGSVSAHLVHHCPCTVVVIRHEEHSGAEERR